MKQIQLTQGMIAVVDDDDFDRFSHFRWFYRAERNGNHGYAVRHGKKTDATTTVYLHREVLGVVPPGHEAIFLNHDRLDCRRDNLRIATKEEARQHHRVRKDCQAKHKGMTFNERANTVSVDIMVNGRMKRIGTFYTQKEAIEEYKKAERYYYPDRPAAPEKVDRAAFRQQIPNRQTNVSQRSRQSVSLKPIDPKLALEPRGNPRLTGQDRGAADAPDIKQFFLTFHFFETESFHVT